MAVIFEETLSYRLPTAKAATACITAHVHVEHDERLSVLVIDRDADHINGCTSLDDDGETCVCKPIFPITRRECLDVRGMSRADVVRRAVAAGDGWRAMVEKVVNALRLHSVGGREDGHELAHRVAAVTCPDKLEPAGAADAS